MPNAELTATRCAILGQLALRDWSSYELTRSMRRTLRWFWPRAQSGIYAEARRLEAAGLAVSRSEPAADGSKRTRTVYSITELGRTVLADWLASPPEVFAMHLEPLLRVHLARFGSRADLLAAIEAAEQKVATLLSDADAVANEFVTGTHLFQDESDLRGLLFSALVGQAEALQTWAHDARAEVETWATLAGDAGSRQRGVERMRAYLTARKRVRDPETRGGRTAPPRRLRHRA